jgi:hypothetical protein
MLITTRFIQLSEFNFTPTCKALYFCKVTAICCTLQIFCNLKFWVILYTINSCKVTAICCTLQRLCSTSSELYYTSGSIKREIALQWRGRGDRYLDLPACHSSIRKGPEVVTDCSPCTIVHYFNSSNMVTIRTVSKSDVFNVSVIPIKSYRKLVSIRQWQDWGSCHNSHIILICLMGTLVQLFAQPCKMERKSVNNGGHTSILWWGGVATFIQ